MKAIGVIIVGFISMYMATYAGVMGVSVSIILCIIQMGVNEMVINNGN